MSIGEGLENIYGSAPVVTPMPTVDRPLAPQRPRSESPMVRAIKAEIAAKAALANAAPKDLPTEKGLHHE